MAGLGFDVLRPASPEEALRLLLHPSARLAAGGTALQLEWSKGLAEPERLIDLGGIARLRGVAAQGTFLRIGAMTRLGDLERDRDLLRGQPLLAAALATVAAPPVRALATIGGNVAGRTGCLLPALLGLDAHLEIFGSNGRRREALSDWLAQPDPDPSLIEAILLPKASGERLWTHRKTGLRAAFTPSVIGVAGLLDLHDERIAAARLAVGGGIVPAARLPGIEAMLRDRLLAEVDWAAVHAAILEAVVAPDDVFRTGGYRRRVAANALVYGLGGGLPGRRPATGPRIFPRAVSPVGESPLSRNAAGGRWHVRPDGPDKIMGRLAYLTDRREPDMLVGRILRAGIPHAGILSIDVSRAEALPGVAAVVTWRDVPGENGFGIVVQDQPALCRDKVRYVGDAVAAVAARDAETAARALELIEVDYRPLPVVGDPVAALASGAEEVHQGGNLQCRLDYARGDVEGAFEGAAHVVEAVYAMSRQMHGFMETEGGHARIEADGGLLICAGGQHGRRDRLQLSRILAMPEEKIRVVTSPTGGAFGGKDELTVQPALALLALKSGRPVRLQLDRAESVQAGIKRHPMTIRMRTACDAAGRLLAQDVDVLSDAGAYASLGPHVLETALEHACGPYVAANVRAAGRLAYTNNGVCGAFRGFGANQMTYAIECQMDRLAAVSGLDPFEIRRRNLRRPGTPGYLGQRVAPSERLAEMLAAAEADPLWSKPRGPSSDGMEIVGVGMAMNYQGNGLGSLPPDPGGGILRLAADGAIEALIGLDEMGQGLLTSVMAEVSRALGCGREEVRPVVGDTGRVPESGSTTASRGGFVVWKVAQAAAPLLRARILAEAGRLLRRETGDLLLAPGGIAGRGSNKGDLLLSFRDLAAALPPESLPEAGAGFEFPKTDYVKGNARFLFAFGATLARVAVSRLSGEVRVLDLTQHTAAGPVIDVAAYLGQIEGGGIQGLGFTLTEHADMEDGRYLAANLDGYMLPGIQDTPASMIVHALEGLDEGDPFGPRGVGEIGIGAVTPAIANAVADAIGAWPERTPIEPEWILDAMERCP
ncbi:molybdopterin cofactor-binding domain-containing protein [Telmatospirillum siberiense]|uniref:Aldehyde oxidase n=1 Tax=Telmatospirillum siberiense TaxID=382514 RepID=A0A2N3PYI7_9PROT|nr:molybdopterin cofactor-binding domain-containing protein [Telmatospirillum siberiense]PKU25474.1 aldehyde oxidase [Telmatospirillum siberiense]